MYSIIEKYLGLIRFSHTLFALPFALLSATMALKLNLMQEPSISPRWTDGLGILCCMVFARSAAMGFNRWADRKIDAENPRTAGRHLPAGVLSARNVLVFVLLSSFGFIVSTLIFLPNTIPIVASVPVLLFLFGYSYAKRWTVTAHFWLGASLMLAPMAAWIVVRPIVFSWQALPVPWPPVLLGLAVMFWSAGFDLIYATQDADHDAQAGLFSVPGRLGIPATFRLAAVCHVLSVLLFAAIPLVYEPFGVIFWCGTGVVALILVAEHFLATPRRDKMLDLEKVNVAFFQMNAVVSLGLLVIGMIDLFF